MSHAAPVSVRPHLLFRLDESWFVVEALAVRETIALPELTAVAEAPLYIAGVLNLRGRVLPVMDLRRRFGGEMGPRRIEDAVVVLEWKGTLLGMIVSEIADVCGVAESQLSPAPDYGTTLPGRDRFVSGMARVSKGLAMRLVLENLFRLPSPITAPVTDAVAPAIQHCTLGKRADIFRDRAHSYAQECEAEELTGLIPIAVVGLQGEFFAFDLGVVREFADLRDPAPVPCCPPHVLGLMNLRGDLLTVVVLRAALGLPVLGATELRKAVIVQWEGGVAGVAVHELCDVIYLRPADIVGIPAPANPGGDDHRKGAAAYRDRMMCLLDLPKLLNRTDLIVNEEI
jgi:purine-binding chemotaxis protein CheW